MPANHRLVFRYPPVPDAPLLQTDEHLDAFARLFRCKALSRPESGVAELVVDHMTFLACTATPSRPGGDEEAAELEDEPDDESDLDDVWGAAETAAIRQLRSSIDGRSTPPGPAADTGSATATADGPVAASAPKRPAASFSGDVASLTVIFVVAGDDDASSAGLAATREGLGACSSLLATALALEEGRCGYVSREAAAIGRIRDESRGGAAELATAASGPGGAGAVSAAAQPGTPRGAVSGDSAGRGATDAGLSAAAPALGSADQLFVPGQLGAAAAAAASGAAPQPCGGDAPATEATEVSACAAATARSPLARELAAVADRLSSTGEAHIVVNGWLAVSLCSASSTMTDAHGAKSAMSSRSRRADDATAAVAASANPSAATHAHPAVPQATTAPARVPGRPVVSLGPPSLSSRLRPYHALLLMDDAATTLRRLPAEATPQLRALILAASPLRSLQQLQLATGVDELQMLRLAEHLVAWGRAVAVPVVTRQARFVTALRAAHAVGPPVVAAASKAGPWGLPPAMELDADAPSAARVAAVRRSADAAADDGRQRDDGATPPGGERVVIAVPGVAHGSSHALAFAERFCGPLGVVPLPGVLAAVSEPRALPELVTLLPPPAQPHILEMLLWMMRRGLVDRVRESALLVPSGDVAPALALRVAETLRLAADVEVQAPALLERFVAEGAAAAEACDATGTLCPTGERVEAVAAAGAALLIALAADTSPDAMATIGTAADEPAWRRRHKVLRCLVRAAPLCDGQLDTAEVLWRTGLSAPEFAVVCSALPDLIISIDM